MANEMTQFDIGGTANDLTREPESWVFWKLMLFLVPTLQPIS